MHLRLRAKRLLKPFSVLYSMLSSLEHAILLKLFLCSAVFNLTLVGSVFLYINKPVPKAKALDALRPALIVTPVELGNVELDISGYGTVEPLTCVKVSSEIKGRIERCRKRFRAGEFVKKGEVLVTIDSDDYRLNFKEAEAECDRLKAEDAILRQVIKDTALELEAIEKDYNLEQKKYARVKLLLEKSVGNIADVEHAEQRMSQKRKLFLATRGLLSGKTLELQTLRARLRSAKAKQERALLNIDRCEVKAPFSGRLKSVEVEDGEFVNVGSILFSVADDSVLLIPVPLDSSDTAKIIDLSKYAAKLASTNWFEIPDDIPVTVEWSENAIDFKWSGRVLRVEQYDPQTRTVKFIVEVSDMKSYDGVLPLVDGMFCRVVFAGREIENAVRIPWRAVQLDRKVFVVDSDGKFQEREVELISIDKATAVVVSGIEPSDMIITQRVPRGLVNGMSIDAISSSGDVLRRGFSDDNSSVTDDGTRSLKTDTPLSGKSANE